MSHHGERLLGGRNSIGSFAVAAFLVEREVDDETPYREARPWLDNVMAS